MKLNEIIGKFEGAKKLKYNSFQCKCPAHKDDRASLTITEKGDKILMYCHASCNIKDILRKVNLTQRDLFNNERSNIK